MAHAYAPGLTVSEKTIYRKERRLPLKGHVVVNEGAVVAAREVVARTDLPGAVYPLNLAHKLGINERDVPEAMLVQEGASVQKGQVIGRATSFFGLFTRVAVAPITGTVESVSQVTGQVMFRAAPIPVELNAFVDGQVVAVMPGEGVVVETAAAFIQGIFGIGGETQGDIQMLATSPQDILDAPAITSACAGKVIVGGSLVTIDAIRKAIREKVAGIIAGGLNDADLRQFLGYDLGVAVTGNENRGLSLIVTEGFGKIQMAGRTFGLLQSHEGRQASICGATQIRAGVMRPEIVIRLESATGASAAKAGGAMQVGSLLRLIRDPYFGELARVRALPVELVTIETEAKVRVVEVELGSGERVTLPRANVELIGD